MVGEHCTRITIWHKQRIGHESATSVSAYPAFVAHSTVIRGRSTWGCSGRSSRCRRGRRRKHVVGVLHGSKKSWKTKKISPLRYQGLNKHVRTLSTSGSFNFWDSCCCSLLHGTVNNAFWKINSYFFSFSNDDVDTLSYSRFPMKIKTKIRYLIICCYLIKLWEPDQIRYRTSVLIPIGNRPIEMMKSFSPFF